MHVFPFTICKHFHFKYEINYVDFLIQLVLPILICHAIQAFPTFYGNCLLRNTDMMISQPLKLIGAE